MSVWPEERLADQLKNARGPVEISAPDLLEAFGVRRFSSRSRDDIGHALGAVGIDLSPPKWGPEGDVTLIVTGNVGEARNGQPPATNGGPQGDDFAEGNGASNGQFTLRPRRATREEVRAAALSTIAETPLLTQDELARRVHEITGAAVTSAIKVIRELENERALSSLRRQRHKVYVLHVGFEPPEPPVQRAVVEPEPEDHDWRWQLRRLRRRWEETQAQERRRVGVVAAIIAGAVCAFVVAAALKPVTEDAKLRTPEAATQERLTEQFDALSARRVPLPADEQKRLLAMKNPVKQRRKRISLLAAQLGTLVPPGRAVARLAVPKLGLNLVVAQGVAPTTVRAGVGHDPRTALPGENGAVALLAHDGRYGAAFKGVQRLVRGDLIFVTLPYGEFTYRVTFRGIVPTGIPIDFKYVGANRLVLAAGDPPFDGNERVLVYARLKKSEPRGPAING